MDEELITMRDATEKFGYSRDWLRQQIREGNLPDLPESGWISRQELEKLARESLRRQLTSTASHPGAGVTLPEGAAWRKPKANPRCGHCGDDSAKPKWFCVVCGLPACKDCPHPPESY